MTVARVFDRQLVKVELLLQLVKFVRLGVLERHPHESTRIRQMRADLADGDIGDPATVVVGGAVDQHTAILRGRA